MSDKHEMFRRRVNDFLATAASNGSLARTFHDIRHSVPQDCAEYAACPAIVVRSDGTIVIEAKAEMAEGSMLIGWPNVSLAWINPTSHLYNPDEHPELRRSHFQSGCHELLLAIAGAPDRALELCDLGPEADLAYFVVCEGADRDFGPDDWLDD